jgi:hypothetical protein
LLKTGAIKEKLRFTGLEHTNALKELPGRREPSKSIMLMEIYHLK